MDVSNVGAFKLSPTDLAVGGVESALFGADGFSFKDILDVVNPFQQLPVVSSIYREATGEGIGAFARLVGGFLFGGPIGLAMSAANLAVEGIAGQDVGSMALSMFDSDSSTSSSDSSAFNLAAGKYQAAAAL